MGRVDGGVVTQLSLSGVAVEFGATTLLEDVTFTIAAGERWGIVGRNGTGKTTLFRLITGALAPTRGAVARTAGLRISLLEQHRVYDGATTVWEAAAGPFAELGLAHARYSDERWLEKLADEPLLLKTPLVRYQQRLTIGLAEREWTGWTTTT